MSKTIENLKAAFAGESQARNKYTFFAEVAREEGYHYIAKIFEETAFNEMQHAKDHLKLLNGISDTLTNLKEAMGGEDYEVENMYPQMAKEAEEEGRTDAKIPILYPDAGDRAAVLAACADACGIDRLLFGTKLFERSGRSLKLTTAGQSLYEDVNPLVSQLDATTSRHKRTRARTTLNISVQPFFASELFVPRLTDFTQQHPEPAEVILPPSRDETGLQAAPILPLDSVLSEACALSLAEDCILILDQLQAAKSWMLSTAFWRAKKLLLWKVR